MLRRTISAPSINCRPDFLWNAGATAHATRPRAHTVRPARVDSDATAPPPRVSTGKHWPPTRRIHDRWLSQSAPSPSFQLVRVRPRSFIVRLGQFSHLLLALLMPQARLPRCPGSSGAWRALGKSRLPPRPSRCVQDNGPPRSPFTELCKPRCWVILKILATISAPSIHCQSRLRRTISAPSINCRPDFLWNAGATVALDRCRKAAARVALLRRTVHCSARASKPARHSRGITTNSRTRSAPTSRHEEDEHPPRRPRQPEVLPGHVDDGDTRLSRRLLLRHRRHQLETASLTAAARAPVLRRLHGVLVLQQPPG